MWQPQVLPLRLLFLKMLRPILKVVHVQESKKSVGGEIQSCGGGTTIRETEEGCLKIRWIRIRTNNELTDEPVIANKNIQRVYAETTVSD